MGVGVRLHLEGSARGARRATNKGFARRPQRLLEGLYVAIPAFGRGMGVGVRRVAIPACGRGMGVGVSLA